MRQIPAQRLSDMVALLGEGFPPVWDGYVLPRDPAHIDLDTDRKIPMIIGWAADEGSWFTVKPTYQNGNADFVQSVRKRFGSDADNLLKLYPATTPQETSLSAQELAGDEEIDFPAWKWSEEERKAGKAPLYRYIFDFRPPAPAYSRNPIASRGAYHTSDVIYMFDNLQVRSWPFRPGDQAMADMMSSYWANFIKTGNPNGPGLPHWSMPGEDGMVMYLGQDAGMKRGPHEDRYKFLDTLKADAAPAH